MELKYSFKNHLTSVIRDWLFLLSKIFLNYLVLQITTY